MQDQVEKMVLVLHSKMSSSKPRGYVRGRLLPKMALELARLMHSFPSMAPDCPG